ncbi:MAG: hypothetical protein ACOC46_01150 [Pirellulales bacterium]
MEKIAPSDYNDKWLTAEFFPPANKVSPRARSPRRNTTVGTLPLQVAL